MTDTALTDQLHPGLQRWMYEEKWEGLRGIQRTAIPTLLAGSDAVLMAPTAGGKTEAAFLPLLSRLADAGSGCILAVSPLKALINDQHQRIVEMTRHLDVGCHRWHGDVGASERKRAVRDSKSVLIITPESLEAGFVRRSELIGHIARHVQAVVIDEIHAFLDNERGMHLRSLLARLAQRRAAPFVQRVGLSATIGNPEIATRFLCGDDAPSCAIHEDPATGTTLRFALRGIEASETDSDAALEHIARELFDKTRGRSNLVFANSRNRVETLADKLRQRSDDSNVPNEFFPHHGNLSRELRQHLEHRLRDGDRPTTAICTSTLELGIDIGSVTSVGQVGLPPSVAAMRQRVGRSGRRKDEHPTLRMFIIGPPPTARSTLVDDLQMETVQGIAMLDLMLDRWIEDDTESTHLSTLVHQILALLCERGAMSAQRIWKTLCAHGVFDRVDQPLLKAVLRDLGNADVMYQLDDGLLTLTERGDSITNRHDFYAAFDSPDEYRVIHDGTVLGTLPVDGAVGTGSTLVFAGRRWKVDAIDTEAKTILVSPAKSGKPPTFISGGGQTHRKIHQRMFRTYIAETTPAYADEIAQHQLAQGRTSFANLDLRHRRVVGGDTGSTHILLWAGDRIHATIALMLRQHDVRTALEGATIRCDNADEVTINDLLHQLRTEPPPDPLDLARLVPTFGDEKFHYLLDHETIAHEYAADRIDISGAIGALADFE